MEVYLEILVRQEEGVFRDRYWVIEFLLNIGITRNNLIELWVVKYGLSLISMEIRL